MNLTKGHFRTLSGEQNRGFGRANTLLAFLLPSAILKPLRSLEMITTMHGANHNYCLLVYQRLPQQPAVLVSVPHRWKK